MSYRIFLVILVLFSVYGCEKPLEGRVQLYDDAAYDRLISSLKQSGIPYKNNTKDRTVTYNSKYRDKVQVLFKNAINSVSYSFVVFSVFDKDEIIKRLEEDGISYEVRKTDDGGFRFIIAQSDHENASEIFRKAIGVNE